MFKIFARLLLVASALLSIPFALATPTDQNTVKIQGVFEFSSLDPTRSGYIFTRMQVLETLINVDSDGKLIPGLARQWSLLEGGRVWELTLRDGVYFHDGSLLNAQLVVDNLNLVRNKPSALKKVDITKIEAIDDKRVRITLAKPYRPLGAILANYSTALISPKAINEQGEVTALVGTGPFSVYEVAIPHKLVVKKFAGYWGQVAAIDYASYLTGHRSEARVLQARSGQADIVFGIDPAAVPALKILPNISVIRSDLPRTLALKLNAGHPLLADVKVREALSLGIDRKGIATAILRSPEAVTSQLLHSYMKDWYVDSAQTDYDQARAQTLLVEAGWQKNKSGFFEKGGKLFELNLITYADRPELTTVATAIQDQWKKLGVKLNVSITNSSAIPAGHQDGSLEVALIARNYGSIADPLGVLIKDFGNKQGGDWGSMNWFNPSIQSVLNQLVQETDAAKYHAQAQQVAKAIYDEKPLIPIAYYVQQTAVGNRINGFQFDPYERSYYLNEISWKN